MCHLLPVPVVCGILFLISEVLKNTKMARKLNLEADESAVFKKEFVDDDDGEEHYEDVKFEEVCKKNISLESKKSFEPKIGDDGGGDARGEVEREILKY